MNQVTLCGYLVRDFEYLTQKIYEQDRDAKTHSPVKMPLTVRNFLAISQNYSIKEYSNHSNNTYNTVNIEHTDFIPIVLFGKKAETALTYLKKGDKFLGTGKIKTSSYINEHNEKKYTWQVIINQFEFVNGKPPVSDKEGKLESEPINEKELQEVTEFKADDEENTETTIF